MSAKIRRLADEVIETIQEAESCIEGIDNRMRRLEEQVAGDNAFHFRAAERLIGTSKSALEEATQWLEEIK